MQMTSRFRRILGVVGAYAAYLALCFMLIPAVPDRLTPIARADMFSAVGNMGAWQPAGVAKVYTTTGVSVPIIVKYVGSSTSGKVAVAANGDLTFTEGAEGAEAATTAFECPVSGALGGVIDVSDAACNTIGEVVDTINGSCTGCTSTNWRAVVLDALRSDSSDDTLVTISATAATAATGLSLVHDTAVGFLDTTSITDCRDFTCGYLGNRGISAPPLIENPWAGTRGVVWRTTFTDTFGSGTSTLQIYNITNIKNKVGANGAETATLLYSIAGGATTVASTNDFPMGFFGSNGGKMLVRLSNSAAMSSVNAAVYAMKFPIH